MFVFFFKQKTAYEMRISDWSSDVCSSDLSAGRLELDAGFILFAPGGQQRIAGECRTRAGQEGGRIADIGRDADHRFIDRADAPGESVGVAVYHAIAEVAHDVAPINPVVARRSRDGQPADQRLFLDKIGRAHV